MALPQRVERILLTGVLGLLFLGNVFVIWMYLGFEGGFDFYFVLLALQAIVLVVCSALLWTNRATGKLAQYFFIALGFYLLAFGLCVSVI
jgi:hypothetical protein